MTSGLERPSRSTLEEILVWSAVGSLGLNLVAATIFGFVWLTRRLGSESCLGMCGESHIGNPVALGLIFSGGLAFYLSVLALFTAPLVVLKRPQGVPALSRVRMAVVGFAAFAVEWAVFAAYGGAAWTSVPARMATILLVLSVSMPLPLVLPVLCLVYAVYVGVEGRRLGGKAAALGIAALLDLAFGVHWLFFTERSF